MFEVMTLVDQVVYGKRVQQPVPYAPFFYIIGIFYVIAIAVPFVTFDIDVEYFFDGVPVMVECVESHIFAVAHSGVSPTLVDFFEGDSSGPVDGIDQPDVTVEQIFCHDTNIMK